MSTDTLNRNPTDVKAGYFALADRIRYLLENDVQIHDLYVVRPDPNDDATEIITEDTGYYVPSEKIVLVTGTLLREGEIQGRGTLVYPENTADFTEGWIWWEPHEETWTAAVFLNTTVEKAGLLSCRTADIRPPGSDETITPPAWKKTAHARLDIYDLQLPGRVVLSVTCAKDENGLVRSIMGSVIEQTGDPRIALTKVLDNDVAPDMQDQAILTAMLRMIGIGSEWIAETSQRMLEASKTMAILPVPTELPGARDESDDLPAS